MPIKVRPEATLRAYGDIQTDRDLYRPLDTVTLSITGRARRDERCFVRVEDAALNPYFEAEVLLKNNQGTVSFLALGKLGTHWVYLRFPDTEAETVTTASVPPAGERGPDTPAPMRTIVPLYYAPNFRRPDYGPDLRKPEGATRGPDWHVRYTNFVLDAETRIETGDKDYDALYRITRDRMRLNRRVFRFGDREMAYYCSADSWATSAAWLRDWIYHMPAARFWECELTGGLDQFAEVQQRDGMIPDMVKHDGSTYRMSVESDVEYIAVMAVWHVWRVTGNNTWMAGKIPMLEKALAYIQSDPLRWDAENQLVTRAHTCDTWDFEIGGNEHYVGGRKVVATCDQSGYYMAYIMMSEMKAALGDKTASRGYAEKAEAYKSRANALLWDGVKYQHHVHRTPVEHPGFDESQQLAAGNTWAASRGLASPEQARSIIDEYKRRHAQTGDAFPWWSLQPGYPESLGYWPDTPHCVQGAYANGGLLPYVGAELARSCFMHGRENYGVELLQQYIDHLRKTGNGVYVWYWPNGEPGLRTANEVPHTGWGMAEWFTALLEGLGGFHDEAPRMAAVRLTPRWAATDRKEAYVSARYAANDSYFAYRMSIDGRGREIRIDYTGSGDKVAFSVLLPDGWQVRKVTSGQGVVPFTVREIDRSRYVEFEGGIAPPGRIVVKSE